MSRGIQSSTLSAATLLYGGSQMANFNIFNLHSYAWFSLSSVPLRVFADNAVNRAYKRRRFHPQSHT